MNLNTLIYKNSFSETIRKIFLIHKSEASPTTKILFTIMEKERKIYGKHYGKDYGRFSREYHYENEIRLSSGNTFFSFPNKAAVVDYWCILLQRVRGRQNGELTVSKYTKTLSTLFRIKIHLQTARRYKKIFT